MIDDANILSKKIPSKQVVSFWIATNII